jgi:hypothetical protein
MKLPRRIPLVLGLIDMPAAGTTLQPPVRIERIVKGRHADALHRCAGGRNTDVSGQLLQWTCQPLRQQRTLIPLINSIN